MSGALGGLGEIGKIPELRRRVGFTILMLAVYRLGVYVSTPGIDVEALRSLFQTDGGTLFGMINMFSGGSLINFSIFTLGIMPYISVSIIIQMLTPAIPALDALRKEGESGRKILTRYTRQGTIALALFQSIFISMGLENQGLVVAPGWMFRISTMITLTAGTAFIMWLGEQITEKGLGNGISIIIFAGIVASMPAQLVATIALAQTGEISPLSVLAILAFCFGTIAFIVYVERAHRKIPIQYPRRMVGKNMTQAQTQYLPLKVNMAGVIPPIFANAILVLPSSFGIFSKNEMVQDVLSYLQPHTWSFALVFTVLIFVFTFFYVPIIFNPEEVAENLKKNGGFVPTVRPGKPTADFLYRVLNRITVWGALYITLVCIIPQTFYFSMGAQGFTYVFGGTAILIVVAVTLDTASQIESYVVSRNYEAFMSRSSKKRGGIGSMSYARSRLLRR